MDKKTLVVAASNAAQVIAMLEEQGTLSLYEIITVPDDKFDEVADDMTELLKDTPDVNVRKQIINSKDDIIDGKTDAEKRKMN